MAVVIDTSVAAAVIFREPGGDNFEQRLAGQQLYAPRLIDYELANVAWKKLRRLPGSAVAISQMLADSARLGVSRADPDLSEVLALSLPG